ncbi:serine carboxypeptidase-like 50-like [Dorcoceras hygrometricum]|uniref:Carboxypeptidase n=1 Tax=Dorcoceras hygrometricum TaxID=472368 RepID=A0A2Z7D1H2_9LAMI|nr:serine carboxypeptidase-like 50-like [Dorcoceras hygrometricum]
MVSPPSIFLLLLLAAILRHSVASPPASSASPFPKEALPTKSGYLSVNSSTSSAIFYAFYEAQSPYNNTPLSQLPILIWLQGGPGCSSMIGNFYELGPWRVNQQFSLDPNPGSWNKIFGLLFLDNPIGTGFSIADSIEEIPRNQYGVAEHLFEAIQKFVALDKSFRSRPIYITGESYAGKYLPALGYYTLHKNALLPSEGRVNLAGVAIGNGLTDPEIQVGTHAVHTYNLGLINDKEKSLLEKLQLEAIELVKSGDWSEATYARTRVLNTLENMTGLATLYDFRRLIPYQDDLVATFLNNVEAKKALRAKESIIFETCSDVVENVLHDDVMKSVRYMVEFLVKNTKVLLYQGQCDLRDGVVSTLAWVKKMDWEGIDEFLEAERRIWSVGGKLAGYVQKWESLSHVVVLNAGHLVPTDQPVNSRVMIEDWVLEKGLFAAKNSERKNDFKRTI